MEERINEYTTNDKSISYEPVNDDLDKEKLDNVMNGVHTYTKEEDYVPPQNEEVAKHLAWFKGLKLGLMMHWSPATQIGVMESWPLCDGDDEWSQVEIDWTSDMDEFRKQYWDLNKTFNPIRFQPQKLAKFAKECGFKYVLFTTKHHDGFCMYDSAETDYKITAPDSPFSTHQYADITKSLFDAARAEGLAVSAYFSKPDWHNDYYWRKEFGIAGDRNVNYSIKEHPELWERFVQFTHNQLKELTSNYGKIDVLWLDGGWVRPSNLDQDIRLGEVVDQIRETTQPHLIVCDRTVGGAYENIVTPEQELPKTPLHIPWEACISLGNYFSFHYEDQYKSGRELVHLLLDIVSKGGSLALNLTIRPDGGIPQQAIASLSQLGQWLETHGEGIYDSNISSYSTHGNIAYTEVQGKTYAYVLYSDMPYLPRRMYVHGGQNVNKVTLIRTQQEIPFEVVEDMLWLDLTNISIVGAAFADCFIIE